MPQGLAVPGAPSIGAIGQGISGLIAAAVVAANLISSSAQNDLTNAGWAWNAQGSYGSVTPGGVTATSAQYNGPIERQYGFTALPRKPYTYTIIASNPSSGGATYAGVGAYDGSQYSDAYVNLSTGANGFNSSGLGATMTVTAGPGASEYTITVHFTTTNAVGSGANVQFGVGSGNVGLINGRAFSLTQQ